MGAKIGHIVSQKTRDKIRKSVKLSWKNPEFRNRMIRLHTGKKGVNASNWQGGKTRNGKGYIFIYNPTHPFATKRGYVKRSRLVMEKKLGRYLKPKEVVHHINSVVTDDRLKNLKLFANNGNHIAFHFSIGTKFNHKVTTQTFLKIPLLQVS